MKQIQKISLIGLGAMGVFFAPRLAAAYGEDFRVIASGERKTRLESRGVTVNKINYKFPILTPETSGDPADLILIGVKGYALEQAIEDIRNQVGENTLIISLLNGVDSEERLVGIVTIDDAIEVLKEETEEDFSVMAAITPMQPELLE